jgi:hypothetical protein
MRTHRKLAPIITLLAILAAAALPAAAGANPLLSGYGGPGVGNQAILGSALLNGGESTGGGSGTTGQGSSPAGAPVIAATPTAGERVAQGAPRSAASRGAGKVSGFSSSAYSAFERGASAPASGTLGLSGQDVLFILLALVVLAFTGVLTRRLMADPQRESTSS